MRCPVDQRVFLHRRARIRVMGTTMAGQVRAEKGSGEKFHFNLQVGDGGVVATSETYESKESALHRVRQGQRAGPEGRSTAPSKGSGASPRSSWMYQWASCQELPNITFMSHRSPSTPARDYDQCCPWHNSAAKVLATAGSTGGSGLISPSSRWRSGRRAGEVARADEHHRVRGCCCRLRRHAVFAVLVHRQTCTSTLGFAALMAPSSVLRKPARHLRAAGQTCRPGHLAGPARSASHLI
jgi:uncharacterized protein YegP (UPF0339 family)